MSGLLTPSNDGRPTTASSIETDLTSQAGNAPSVLSNTGPVGEPGLPPSRQTDSRNSRRGFAAFGQRSRHSRPESASNSTHVNFLAASSNFFRPMSPQKLQVQRGQSIHGMPEQQRNSINEEVNNDDQSKKSRMRSHRNSNASVHTMRDPARKGSDAPPLPSSRGGYSVATSAGGAPLGGSVDSTAPLDTRTLQQRELDEKAEQKKRLGLGMGSRHSSRRDVQDRIDSPRLASHPTSTSTDQEKPYHPERQGPPGKNYEYYGGNMLFFLAGRCLNTRAMPLNILTFVIAIIPALLFFIFSAPYLWTHVSHAIPIIFGYITFITLSSFIHAAFSDPGILPRNLHPHPDLEEENDPLAPGPATTEWVMVKTFSSKQQQTNPEGTAEAAQQTTAMELPTKYCKTCNIWRPPRTHHCRICDGCMETQDHHCVWLNNCVGRRNYRYFFTFIGVGSVMALLLVAFTALHLQNYANSNNTTFVDALSGRIQERVAFATMIYALLALPYPGSLFVYHLFLVGRGETTREYLNGHKFLPVDRHRPFSLNSPLKNYIAVLTRPRGPSYLSFKRRYQEGDVRLGHGTRKRDRVMEEKAQARDSKKRVEGLKQRYTVGGGGGKDEEKQQGTEMKDLPGPPSTANGGGNGRPAVLGRLNSTPRSGGVTPRVGGGKVN